METWLDPARSTCRTAVAVLAAATDGTTVIGRDEDSLRRVLGADA